MVLTEPFFKKPILNSPYERPSRHWELDGSGQPTQKIIESRRSAEFVTPIPVPKKRKGTAQQARLVFDEAARKLESAGQQYDPAVINGVRRQVDRWRELPEARWQVTPETARLLRHWRGHRFSGIRPFFCQVEAAETAIWLTEVAPGRRAGRDFLDHLDNANDEANPDLPRLALKLATGAGKTTVMAMLIAWQTVNAVRRPQSRRFTRGFLVVTPGITIKDRLRVLQPNDPDSYYQGLELVPGDMLPDLEKARIVITNYHAFKRRERLELSKGGRSLLQGRGESIATVETEGQMLQRVMPELMGLKNILVLNDEAHHCYREKPGEVEEEALKGDDRKEAEKNREAARLWISGLETVGQKLGLNRVIDLSATPFFLRGSGYAEGTLFPWTMCDFSLMDAIECGIVKLPRVPVADNIPGGDMPKFRNLWEHIREDMPKKGRGKASRLDPLSLPVELQTALEALYGHYRKTFEGWDANTVSHVLGVRAFGTQLLCEQVVGRALRRQSYDLNEKGRFNVEYADVLGIPFDFTAKPVVAPPTPPQPTVQVRAMRPERDALEIRFPRVAGYRVELPEERLEAGFNDDSVLNLTPDLVGPSVTRNQGIIGEGVDLNLVHTDGLRTPTLLFHLTQRLLYTKYRDPGEEPKLHLFGQLKRITRQWLDGCLVCKGGTYPAQLMYQELADMACERIAAAITREGMGSRPVKAVLDPYNPAGSTANVNFNTTKTSRYETDSRRCHVNWVVLDSDWEAEFCRVAESHPQVRAYVKNHNLGLEVPYRSGSETRTYLPDFIVLVDDGRGDGDLLHLVVEIKGYRREDAKDKKATMETCWVPGVNNHEDYGRWAFAEFSDVFEVEAGFDRLVEGFRTQTDTGTTDIPN